MSQVDVHKRTWSSAIFQRGRKALFTVELKRREMARYEESLRGRTSHNASSTSRRSFCLQRRILPPRLFDSSREIETRPCCGVRSHIDFHTDASTYRLNFKSLKPTRIPFPMFRCRGPPPVSFLLVALHGQRNDIAPRHDETREGEEPIDR
jgi:hypothetical protein